MLTHDRLKPVQELSATTPIANLLTGHGIDEYFTRADASGTSALLTDALGSTVALADATGTVQTQYTYEPFGGTAVSGQANNNTFKYTGREDDGTGLYYYRARYYHPRLQRFLSEDPLGFASDGQNVYAYVHNTPTGFIDPPGLVSFVAGGGFSDTHIVVPPGGEVGVLGIEGSGGFYLDTSNWSVGGFLAGGPTVGFNVSADVFAGAVWGDLVGTTVNANFVFGKWSFTFMFDLASGDWVGGTIGYGSLIKGLPWSGASLSLSKTGALCLINCSPGDGGGPSGGAGAGSGGALGGGLGKRK